MKPDKGSCNLGYVDLNQFEDFDIEDIVPPPRNNRLTISFWMFVNHFPESEVTASLTNSFSETINFNFKFTSTELIINCANINGNSLGESSLNNWFFVKCAISFDHEVNKKNYL